MRDMMHGILNKLEAFYMHCQRCILTIASFHFVCNTDVHKASSQPVTRVMRQQYSRLFGPVTTFLA